MSINLIKDKLRAYSKCVYKTYKAIPKLKFYHNKYLSKNYDTSKVLRAALIGCGDIGAVNARALSFAKLIKMTTVCDNNAELANGLAKKYGIKAELSFSSLLKDPEVDVVILAVPHHLHAQFAIEALNAGKHVIIEKPMARNAEECKEIISALKQSGKCLSVCFPMRYKFKTYYAKELIANNIIGEILSVRIQVNLKRNAEYWQGGFSGRSKSDWRCKKSLAGGGVLIMNAIHCLEAAAWILEADFSDIQANINRVNEADDVENNASLSFLLKNKVLATLNATTKWPLDSHEIIEFVGTKGILSISDELSLEVAEAVSKFIPGRPYMLIESPLVNERTIFYNEFVEGVYNKKPVVDADKGFKIQEVIDTAYQTSSQ